MPKGDRLPTVWDLTPHTRAKHDILTRYLGAWFGILGNSAYPGVNMIDGFAGPGRYSKGEPGSPILVLDTLLNHTSFEKFGSTNFHFIFNEYDDARFASLQREIAAIRLDHAPWPSNVIIEACSDNFQLLARELLSTLRPHQKLAPTFAFIDPFGYRDVPMTLIRSLAGQPSFELFIYFDFNSVNRFATAGNVDSHFDELFGCSDYKNAPPSGRGRGEFLHDLYERQLREVCDFTHVRSFGMVNNKGRTGNYLFFCTNNANAYDKMKAAMWKLSPTGSYSFDDRLAGQTVLFGDEADTGPLQDELAGHFSGRTVDVQKVIDYVVIETPFHSGQVKRLTLKPMETSGRISSPNPKRKGQFPAGTLIEFLG